MLLHCLVIFTHKHQTWHSHFAGHLLRLRRGRLQSHRRRAGRGTGWRVRQQCHSHVWNLRPDPAVATPAAALAAHKSTPDAGSRHSGPNYAEPCHSGAYHSGPCHSGPCHSGPNYAEPCHSGAYHSSPRHASPCDPPSGPPPTGSPPTGPPPSQQKYICKKNDPGSDEICLNGSLLDGTCSELLAPCGNGGKKCHIASCPTSGPTPTPAPVEPPTGPPPPTGSPPTGPTCDPAGSQCGNCCNGCETSGRRSDRVCL